MVGWLIFAALVVALIWWNPVGRRKPSPPVPADAAVVPITDAAVDAAPVVADAALPEPDAAPTDPLYTIDEALADVAASPLEFIGTGTWHGNYSIKACAYRNTNVLVVYDYCTFREQPALGLHVISPTRGSLHIYVEADKAISTLVRSGYMTLRIEGYPRTETPPRLDFTFDEVNAWHERRYNAHAGACWVTVGVAACSPSMADRLEAWQPSAKSFLDEPPPHWYELAKDMHTRTVRDLRKQK